MFRQFSSGDHFYDYNALHLASTLHLCNNSFKYGSAYDNYFHLLANKVFYG